MFGCRLSVIAFAAFLVLSVMSGCRGDGKQVTPATSATAPASLFTSPTTTQPPSPSGPAGTPNSEFESFREFASQIQAAVRAQDANFFIDNAVLGSLECPNLLHGDCGFPYPTTIVGIRVGLWQSEGTVLPPDEFKRTLGDYLASAPRLHSLGAGYGDVGGAIGGPTYLAILNTSAAPSETTVVLEFVNDGGAWRFSLYLNARTPESFINGWTSGTCAECYDYWERWEGS
jgi:hypothetical protein